MTYKIKEAISNGKLVFKEWLKSFSPEVFEVSFSDVISGRGSKVYLDPDECFANTYLTETMRDVLKCAFSRTAGLSKRGVIHLATGFGGGKSHLLTLLYHVFRSRKIIDAQILREAGIEEVPDAEVVAVDGHDLAYPSFNSPLGKYAREKKEDIVKALESAGKPVVVLIDEFVVYLAKLDEKKAMQELANLHTLVGAVQSTEKCLIVVTSPGASSVYGRQSEMLDAVIQKSRLDAEGGKLVSVISRVSQPVVPVEAGDFLSVAKKRLLDRVDEYTARTVEQFMGRALKDLNFEGCYPFHPLLRDVLYGRASLFPDFQKTRDSLKVVALAVKGVLRDPDSADFYLISPGEVPFDDPDAKSILTSERVFGTNLEQAATRDVVERAKQLDVNRKYGRLGRAAAAVFMYSLHPEASKRGALPEEVFECLFPEVKSKEDAEGLLKELHENTDFMWSEGGRYLFKPKQNIPNMIRAKANLVTSTEVTEHVRQALFRTVFPGDPRFSWWLADIKQFDPAQNRINALVCMPWDDVDGATKAALSIQNDRKNTIVVLAPSREQAGNLTYNVRLLLGAEKVMKEVKLDKEAYAEARGWKDKYEGDAAQAFRMMYNTVKFLRGVNVAEEQVDPSRGNALADAVAETLRRRQKLVDPQSVDHKNYINALVGAVDIVRVRDLQHNAENLSSIPFAFKDDLLKILSAGVKNGIIGAVEGVFEGQVSEFVKCHFREPYDVQDGDTVVSAAKAEEILRKLSEIRGGFGSGAVPGIDVVIGTGTGIGTGVGAVGIGRGPGTGAGAGTGAGSGGTGAGAGAGAGSEGEAVRETETIVADLKDLSSALSRKVTDLMMKRIDYEIEMELHGGAVSGKVTAKTREELSAIQSLAEALSKAYVILPAVKATLYITKISSKAPAGRLA